MTKLLTKRDLWRTKTGKTCLVESSVIRSVHYEISRKELVVEFHSGAAYMYERVPGRVIQELMEADSMGKAFSQLIKNQYHFTKLR